MPDDPAKPPRFPYVGALLCAACLGVAVWTWMRYSYSWDVTGEYLYGNAAAIRVGRWPCRSYVRVRGTDACGLALNIPNPDYVDYAHLSEDCYGVAFLPRGYVTHNLYLHVRMPPGTELAAREAGEFAGRVFAREPLTSGYDVPPDERDAYPGVDTTASRFTGASVAGLVVGAMGVFVFTVALRHWLGERRRFREEARA